MFQMQFEEIHYPVNHENKKKKKDIFSIKKVADATQNGSWGYTLSEISHTQDRSYHTITLSCEFIKS